MVLQISLSASLGETAPLVQALETITGFDACEAYTQTVLLTPRFPYMPPEQAGQINQIQSHKMRLTTLWEHSKPCVSYLSAPKCDPTRNWTFQLSDIPIANETQFTSQNIYETTVESSDDIFGYVDELGYKMETEFWTHSLRWYWGDVIIELSQIKVQASSPKDKVELGGGAANAASADSAVEEVILDENMDVPASDGPSTDVDIQLKPLTSNWLVRTMVNVLEINDMESIQRAKRQLEALKKEIGDIVKLTVPHRSSMDSRIGSKLLNNQIGKR